MEFSKGRIYLDGDKVRITFHEGNEEQKVWFKRSSYKEFATLKKKTRPEINKWVLGAITLALMITWISISEHYGNLKEVMTEQEYAKFKSYDHIFMPGTIILFFMTLFFDVFGDVKVVRFLLTVPFTRRPLYLILITKSEDEYEIPVESIDEAWRIADFIQSKRKD